MKAAVAGKAVLITTVYLMVVDREEEVCMEMEMKLSDCSN